MSWKNRFGQIIGIIAGVMIGQTIVYIIFQKSKPS
jgi:glycerol uptake facilitator-like aquaporin